MEEIENAIGYKFKDPVLLETALTAPAYRMDHPSARDNQRLEFLGDAVFGLLCAEAFYRDHADEDEGGMTVRRTHFASGRALATAAESIGLSSHLRLNKAGKLPKPGGKAAADAMEALLGAVWIDGGVDAARAVFARLWPDASEPFDPWADNPKGRLQLYTQSRKPPTVPEYTVMSVSGPMHAPSWKVRASVPGIGEAVCEGPTKHAAEAAAAAEILRIAGIK